MANAAWHHDKRSRHERGYGTAWDRIRPVILARDGYRCQCVDCKRTKALTPATQVDHIVSKADWLRLHGSLIGVDDPNNLQAINKACHERKTLREQGYSVRVGSDADGWPVDPAHPWNTP